MQRDDALVGDQDLGGPLQVGLTGAKISEVKAGKDSVTMTVEVGGEKRKIEVGKDRRVIGATYFDDRGREVFQRAKAVVVSANGAETPRLLLMSKSAALSGISEAPKITSLF